MPFTGVVFYGEHAVERHVKTVHPSEARHYFLNDTRKETESAAHIRQRSTGMPNTSLDCVCSKLLISSTSVFGFQVSNKRFKFIETTGRSRKTSKQTDDTDNVEPPPTLAPEVPVQEVISSTFLFFGNKIFSKYIYLR